MIDKMKYIINYLEQTDAPLGVINEAVRVKKFIKYSKKEKEKDVCDWCGKSHGVLSSYKYHDECRESLINLP